MKKVKGDLIRLAKQGKFDVIVHGCNCFNQMGAGIAAQISKEFPLAYEIDKKTQRGDRGKLGKYSSAKLDSGLTVVNAYTQYDYGSKGQHVDYEAMREVFKRIKQDFSGQRIGYPKIGAGLAGGDWEKIERIINEELEGEDHTLVIFNGNT